MHTSKDSSKAGEKWWPRSCPKCSHCPVNGIPSKQNKDYRNEENLYKAKGHHYAQNGQIIIYSEVERFIHTNMGQLIFSQLLEKEMHDLWWLDQWLPTTALGDSCGEIELFCSLKETQHQGHPLTGDQIRVMGHGSGKWAFQTVWQTEANWNTKD